MHCKEILISHSKLLILRIYLMEKTQEHNAIFEHRYNHNFYNQLNFLS